MPDGTVVDVPDNPTPEQRAFLARIQLTSKGQEQPGPSVGLGEITVGGGFGESPELPAFLLRTAPGLIPAPGASAFLSAGGEIGAQLLESGRITSPGQVALAGALPPGVAAVGRLGRGLMRTGTRLMPSLFERAQRGAQEAGEAMVRGLRPAEDVAALAESARAAGADLIPARNIERIIGEIKLPATPANPRLVAVKTTIENLQSVMKPGGRIDLADLEAIRRDIGPLLQSKAAPSELRGLYGAIVKDLEQEALAGGVGASLARETAKAFKQDLGAAKVAELLERSTARRVISGADVPALDMGRFAKLVQDSKTKKQLMDQIGPGGLRVVEEFTTRFRSLPPTTAYNGWTALLTVLGGGAGFAGAGLPGVALAITPEIIRNMAAVGANPAALNTVMISVSQAIRATGAIPQSTALQGLGR